MFHDMMLQSIMADIKADEFDSKYNHNSKDTSLKENLNIWFSLHNFFTLTVNQKRENMAENLKKHREMMQELIEGKRELQTNEEFAFVTGQVIHYLLSKSQTADKSYARLEPFLQKSDCGEFKKAIVRIFDMYKHENFSAKFSKGMAQIMAFNTEANLKELTPDMLAGFFSDNLLYSDKNKQNDNELN
jgi:CRISPR-associated protein Csh1